MNHHLRFPAGPRRVEAALVGAGAFGRSLLAQSHRMSLLRTRIVVDREAATAAAGFAAAGVPAVDIAHCDTAAEARAAWDRGHFVAIGNLDAVIDLPFDILVEASGQSEPAAAALTAIERSKHVAMVSKEVDSVVGPFLASEAAAKGVVCTPARLKPDRPVHYYLLANKRLARRVPAGALLMMADIDFSAGSLLLNLRRRQDTAMDTAP